MPLAPPSLPPPGWYDDPWESAPLRWWDGHRWSWHVHDPSPAWESPGRGSESAAAVGSVLLAPAESPRARAGAQPLALVPANGPRPAPAGRGAAPTVPIKAGLWGLVAITVLLVALQSVAVAVAAFVPVVPAVLVVTGALYGPM